MIIGTLSSGFLKGTSYTALPRALGSTLLFVALLMILFNQVAHQQWSFSSPIWYTP
jgi:hypothetical protein